MLTPPPHWHHAPLHVLIEQGIYIVTAATYQKQHHFRAPERLQFLHDKLHELATEYGWQLQAWAVLSNHYHIVALSPDDPATLSCFIHRLHGITSRFINQQDGITGRKIWAQYWDTRLTYERSYLARLHYVHTNPVHHGLVLDPTNYRWCSAAHFENAAPLSFRRTVYSMPIDTLNLHDDF
ncbi:hypothetical protein Ga0100231_012270 [Opitutaceae bacterium TAV4]|nr:hypothetical protein Ga0100231_012270 [Opitutaceae bacterium TAV4]RRK01041.1 hypothetical protein Ga0100230_011360 [Opitutaceae bacterium TAV3]